MPYTLLEFIQLVYIKNVLCDDTTKDELINL